MNREFYNDTEKELISMYNHEDIGNCDICKECQDNVKDLSVPIGCWCVGNHFYENEKRVLFVGKNARSEPGEDSGVFSNVFAKTRDVLWNEDSFPFWNYTGTITEKLYGIDSPEYVALTNIVKCNNSAGKDTTPSKVKVNCILQKKIIGEEIKIIKPTHIVFYTARNYDWFIPQIFDMYKENVKKNVRMNTQDVPWSEADASIDGMNLKVLRTGHPQGKDRDIFTDSIVAWVKRT